MTGQRFLGHNDYTCQ